MICMSSSVTSNLIDKIANDYDAAVFAWKDELSRHIQVSDGYMNDNSLSVHHNVVM